MNEKCQICANKRVCQHNETLIVTWWCTHGFDCEDLDHKCDTCRRAIRSPVCEDWGFDLVKCSVTKSFPIGILGCSSYKKI